MYHILSLLCTYTEQGRSLQRLARMTISLFTRAWRGGVLASIIKKKKFSTFICSLLPCTIHQEYIYYVCVYMCTYQCTELCQQFLCGFRGLESWHGGKRPSKLEVVCLFVTLIINKELRAPLYSYEIIIVLCILASPPLPSPSSKLVLFSIVSLFSFFVDSTATYMYMYT